MKEHKQLKEICDVIGYRDHKALLWWSDDGFMLWMPECARWTDVREIIFTTGFMDKFFEYRSNKWIYPIDENEILEHLDDPVSYLHTLILWQ